MHLNKYQRFTAKIVSLRIKLVGLHKKRASIFKALTKDRPGNPFLRLLDYSWFTLSDSRIYSLLIIYFYRYKFNKNNLRESYT